MSQLILTGGRLRARAKGLVLGNLYDDSRIALLDTSIGDISVKVRRRTPADLLPPGEPSHVFKSGAVLGGKLAVVSLTELLVYDLDSFRLERSLSHPSFNDLHDVDWIRDRWHVVDTGLDAVVVMTEEGVVEETISVGPEPTWDRFDPEVDYRRVASTKPHLAHPNHIVDGPGGPWVTRYWQQDAVCLDDPGRSLPIPFGPPHDGILSNGLLWFTTVNGHLAAVDPGSGQVARHVDLNEVEGPGGRDLGWSRGLALEGETAFVGFSRLRGTTGREAMARLSGHGRQGPLPTRVVAYDLRRMTIEAVWDLQEAGFDAVFGILPVG